MDWPSVPHASHFEDDGPLPNFPLEEPLDFPSDDVTPKPRPRFTTAQLRGNLLTAVTGDITQANMSVQNAAITQANMSVQRTKAMKEMKEHIKSTYSDQIIECKDESGGGESPTILHWIARKIKFDSVQETDPTFKAAELLAEIATSIDPKMLSTQDTESKSTPIHLFISHAESARVGVENIVLAMCRAAEKSEGKKYASEAISLQNKADENCLHMAVQKDLGITKDLIEMASTEAVVAVRGIDGNTPLHDAVDSNLCAYSIQECEMKPKTCANCEKLKTAMEAKGQRILQNIATLIAKNPDALRRKNKGDYPPYLHHKQPRKPTRPGASTNKSNFPPMDKEGATSGGGGSEAPKCKSVPSDRLDNEIEKYLVESAFGLGGFEAACECFFGDKADLQGVDSVFRPERPLSAFDSDNDYPFLNCGTTLAQVDLSIDPMERRVKGSLPANDVVLVDEARIALFKIFEMLKKRKVKRILKLTVRDNQKTPCSDEFIESCLLDLDVRYLDWNKPDLCADVIITSAPRVAELWLYATGNTAVLRSWAGSNGLANLHQLRSVHFHSHTGLETYDRHLLSIKAFQSDLRASVDVNRKLKILSMEENLNQAITRVHESQSKALLQHIELIQKQLKDTRTTENQRKRLVTYNQTVREQLEKINDAIQKEKGERPKFVAGMETLLKRKETNLQNIINRLRRLKLNNQDEKKTDTIDISELKDWGIKLPSNLAFRVDFVALEFQIHPTTVQPSTKTGGKLKMKSTSKDDETPFKQHRWVESLRKFVSDHVQGSKSGARVKVALIDDGVDVHLGDLRGKVKAGWPTEKPTSSWAPFYQSTEGHGTAMARLITTACPDVDLYVAKLKTLNKVVSRNETWKLLDDPNSDAWTSTADEAASAIKWAHEQKVHIISMSWSLIQTKQNTAQIVRLGKQISLAASDGIIMYCAAADQGMYGSMKQLYPASADTAHIKVVGSATESGHSSEFVNPEQVNYLFPGEEFEEIGNRKGSSAATALAAGFAALILWCYEVHCTAKNSAKRERMGKPESMNYLFQGLQDLIAVKGSKSDALQNKWVDASMVLDGGGIDSVINFVESEVNRREPR